MSPSRPRDCAALGALGALGAIAGLAVYLAGRTVLASPDFLDPGSWARWFVHVGPVVGVFAIARAVLVGASALWTLTALSLASAGLGGPGIRLGLLMVRLLGRLHLPASTKMTALALGLSVSAVTLGACRTATSPISSSPKAPVLLNPAATSTTSTSPQAAPLHTPTSKANLVAPKSTATIPPGGLWVVRPGDDLWSIAAKTMQLRLGRQPTRVEVAAYWVEVIAVNRRQLPYPNDPSLLYPGDLIALPAS